MSIKNKFMSSNSIHNITTRVWDDINTEKPVAIVQIVHGMCEHIGRYSHVAEFLNSKGIITVGHDQAGHGNSTKDNKLGRITMKCDEKADIKGHDILVQDAYEITHMIKESYKNVPIIILGHSMGSFVVMNYLYKYSNMVDGVILSGTGRSDMNNSIILALTNIIGAIYGQDKDAVLIKNITKKAFNKRIKDKSSNQDWLSTDKEIVKQYKQDKFCRCTFSYSSYSTLFTLIKNSEKYNWTTKINSPVLLISGDQDRVGNYGKGVKYVHNELINNNKRSTLKLYKGLRHEVLNEKKRDEVFEDIVSFINTLIH